MSGKVYRKWTVCVFSIRMLRHVVNALNYCYTAKLSRRRRGGMRIGDLNEIMLSRHGPGASLRDLRQVQLVAKLFIFSREAFLPCSYHKHL